MSLFFRNVGLASARPLFRSEAQCSCFHSSSIVQKQSSKVRGKGPSARTRLVKDLKPIASSSRDRGKYEVAPRLPSGKGKARETSPSEVLEEEERRRTRSRPTASHEPRLERDSAPHLSGDEPRPEPEPEIRTAPYERMRSRIDIEDTLVNLSPKEREEIMKSLPTAFTSPPLMEGLVSSLHRVLGPRSSPTPIQTLSIKHIVSTLQVHVPDREQARRWREFLLASETGSGKSFAYLLPLLQDLKMTESNPFPDQVRETRSRASINPRAIVLAPTHELSRQLTSFAKSLSHDIKLRTLSASRSNVPNISSAKSASQMAKDLDRIFGEGEAGSELELKGRGNAQDRDVDVLVSTPMKLLEMLRGRYWREERPRFPGQNNEKKPEVGFERVEWVVVDEADVLFDPDFRTFTQDLLSDISKQRGHPVSHILDPKANIAAGPVHYPFHLLLTTATIPAMLNSYLEKFHPSMTRLASPNLHRLPRTLKRETVGASSGNRNADVEKRIKQVWAEDAAEGRELSRIVVFCNRSTKVHDLCAYLQKEGVKCVEITSTGEQRLRGSNKHLAGFLKNTSPVVADGDDADIPRVLVTTSLLSRGLDFSPSVSHVFIMDEPRNKVDFLHRAGRTARAGGRGTVVIFGKGKRAADLDRDLKKVRY